MPRPVIQSLDHVAILVGDTERALEYYRDELGLNVVSSEIINQPHARLTYLDAGNTLIQLIQAMDPASDFGRACAEHGDGLHHICFGVDNPVDAAARFAHFPDAMVTPGTGRGRVSAFIPGPTQDGVLIEFTEHLVAAGQAHASTSTLNTAGNGD